MHIASGIWYAVAGPTQYLLGSDEVKTYAKADTMYKVAGERFQGEVILPGAVLLSDPKPYAGDAYRIEITPLKPFTPDLCSDGERHTVVHMPYGTFKAETGVVMSSPIVVMGDGLTMDAAQLASYFNADGSHNDKWNDEVGEDNIDWKI